MDSKLFLCLFSADTQYDRLLTSYCRLTVRLSVCPTLMMCNYGTHSGLVYGAWWHLFTSSDTFAVGRIVQPHTQQKPNRQNFHAWNSHGQCGAVWSRDLGYSRRGISGGLILHSYTVWHTIRLLSNSYASCISLILCPGWWSVHLAKHKTTITSLH